MSIPTEVIMRMATLGLSEDQAKAVADMLVAVETATAAQAEVAKEKARARWRKWNAANGGKRLQTTANASKQLVGEGAHVEDKTSTSEIEPQVSKQNAPSRDVDAFRAGLSPDVPYDLISEFIKVRRKKRGALTGFAAKLFREDAAKVGMTVSEAATECVRSSWITVKPEYFVGRQRAGPAPSKPNPGLETLDALMERTNAVTAGQTEGHPPYPHLVAITGR